MKNKYENPEKLVRTEGTIRGLEDNLKNRTFLEQVDDYQMKIYRLMKAVYPEMTGYEASAIEQEQCEDVVTRFRMYPPHCADMEAEDNEEQ